MCGSADRSSSTTDQTFAAHDLARQKEATLTKYVRPSLAFPAGRTLVEYDRVHRSCYTDQRIFEEELKNIFYKTWIYAAHESQIPKPGDYVGFMLGRQSMLVVRGAQGEVNVLHNRCPHRGAMLCNERKGNTGGLFTCSYHAWQFGLDGKLAALPAPDGYKETRLCKGDPAADMKSAARVSSYRGFIFASLSETGPSLDRWLGNGRRAFDDMCDRAPDGDVEIVNSCFRIVQNNNWKIFLENQLDAVHASITHISAAKAATDTEKEIKEETGEDAPYFYKYISSLSTPLPRWATLETRAYPYGHCLLGGYLGLRPTDPDSVFYENIMREKYGAEKAEEILSRDVHHILIYPCLSVQPAFQQLRAIRPLGPDKTLTELWHFRLKGAPEPIYRRSLAYYNLINSPSTLVNADDLINFWRCQEGLMGEEASEWVSFHRNAGQDITSSEMTRSANGLSEMPMREMFRAWSEYMAGAENVG
jgi:phenylpropionate dioxygenase-like ring-hydroxylating dioxygenase large terminal subunit